MDASIVFALFGIFVVCLIAAAVYFNRRYRRKEVRECTALYPGNDLKSRQKLDTCITQKATARRVAY